MQMHPNNDTPFLCRCLYRGGGYMDCIYLFLSCIFFKFFLMPSLSTSFRRCTDVSGLLQPSLVSQLFCLNITKPEKGLQPCLSDTATNINWVDLWLQWTTLAQCIFFFHKQPKSIFEIRTGCIKCMETCET